MANGNQDRRDERLYRAVNVRIREVAGAFPADGAVEFLCECGRGECAATIELTETQWNSVFSVDESVLLAAEHQRAADGRRRIAENGRFVLAVAS